MRRTQGLNALKIKSMNEPGMYSDGGGLYLQVNSPSSKSWVFRYTIHGRRREMGLGPADLVPLIDARMKARDLRLTVVEGKDPIAERKAEKRKAAELEAVSKTFEACCAEYIASHEKGWSNPKHPVAWRNSLKQYAFPILGKKLMSEITREHVVQVLQPIWYSKPETAKRLQNRIARVLGYAGVMGYRTGENPATWKDNLDHIFPARTKVAAVSNMPSLPRDELPALFAKLKESKEWGSKPLQFLILTVSRTSVVTGAKWEEIDFEKRLWTIPAERMKMRRPHRVPLSEPAMEILRQMRSTSWNHFVFPGRIGGRSISNMTMLVMMRRMGRTEVPHGFRSTFKDWAAECTQYPNEVSEMALAHVVDDKVEAAYRRGDLLEKRVKLMEDWAEFCLSQVRQIVAERPAAQATPELQP